MKIYESLKSKAEKREDVKGLITLYIGANQKGNVMKNLQSIF